MGTTYEQNLSDHKDATFKVTTPTGDLFIDGSNDTTRGDGRNNGWGKVESPEEYWNRTNQHFLRATESRTIKTRQEMPTFDGAFNGIYSSYAKAGFCPVGSNTGGHQFATAVMIPFELLSKCRGYDANVERSLQQLQRSKSPKEVATATTEIYNKLAKPYVDGIEGFISRSNFQSKVAPNPAYAQHIKNKASKMFSAVVIDGTLIVTAHPEQNRPPIPPPPAPQLPFDEWADVAKCLEQSVRQYAQANGLNYVLQGDMNADIQKHPMPGQVAVGSTSNSWGKPRGESKPRQLADNYYDYCLASVPVQTIARDKFSNRVAPHDDLSYSSGPIALPTVASVPLPTVAPAVAPLQQKVPRPVGPPPLDFSAVRPSPSIPRPPLDFSAVRPSPSVPPLAPVSASYPYADPKKWDLTTPAGVMKAAQEYKAEYMSPAARDRVGDVMCQEMQTIADLIINSIATRTTGETGQAMRPMKEIISKADYFLASQHGGRADALLGAFKTQIIAIDQELKAMMRDARLSRPPAPVQPVPVRRAAPIDGPPMSGPPYVAPVKPVSPSRPVASVVPTTPVASAPISIKVVAVEGGLNVANYQKQLGQTAAAKETVFLFPSNTGHHTDATTLYSQKSGGGLANFTNSLFSAPGGPFPTLGLPTVGVKAAADPAVLKSFQDLGRAAGLGLNIAIPVRPTEGVDKDGAPIVPMFNSANLSGLPAKKEPSWWGGVVKTIAPDQKGLADTYEKLFNNLFTLSNPAASPQAKAQAQQALPAEFLKGYQEGLAAKVQQGYKGDFYATPVTVQTKKSVSEMLPGYGAGVSNNFKAAKQDFLAGVQFRIVDEGKDAKTAMRETFQALAPDAQIRALAGKFSHRVLDMVQGVLDKDEIRLISLHALLQVEVSKMKDGPEKDVKVAKAAFLKEVVTAVNGGKTLSEAANDAAKSGNHNMQVVMQGSFSRLKGLLEKVLPPETLNEIKNPPTAPRMGR